MSTSTRKQSFHKRLVSAEAVRTAYANARAAQKEFVEGMNQLAPLLRPEAEQRILKELISRETDPLVMAEAVKKMNELDGDGAKAAKARSHTLSIQLLGKFTPAVNALLQAGQEEADNLISDALTAEKELFADFGMASEATAISEAARALKRRIDGLHNARKGHDHLLSFKLAIPAASEYADTIAFFQ